MKYWDIYHKRFNEIADIVDTRSVNPGSFKGAMILIPLLLITSLFELFWDRIFGRNSNTSDQ